MRPLAAAAGTAQLQPSIIMTLLFDMNDGKLEGGLVNLDKHTEPSPFPLVHVVLVQVSSQAILVSAEGLVASVDVDCPGPGVEDAAVAVATLNQRPERVLHRPRVLGWGQNERYVSGEAQLFSSIWFLVP